MAANVPLESRPLHGCQPLTTVSVCVAEANAYSVLTKQGVLLVRSADSAHAAAREDHTNSFSDGWQLKMMALDHPGRKLYDLFCG